MKRKNNDGHTGANRDEEHTHAWMGFIPLQQHAWSGWLQMRDMWVPHLKKKIVWEFLFVFSVSDSLRYPKTGFASW